jgi:hypothetical protein
MVFGDGSAESPGRTEIRMARVDIRSVTVRPKALDVLRYEWQPAELWLAAANEGSSPNQNVLVLVGIG